MGQQGMQIIFMIVIFFVLGYFLMYRPQKKRNQQAKEMRDNIKVGDKIVTVGGIEGHITQIFDDAYEIRSGSTDSRIFILKQSVNYVIHPKHDKDGNEIDPHQSSGGIEWNEMPGYEKSNDEMTEDEKKAGETAEEKED